MKRISLALVAALALAGCAGSNGPGSSASGDSAAAPAAAAPPAATAPATTTAPGGKVHKLASGLIYEDLVVGNGTMADPGLTVSVHYTGWLTDGTKFDSSLDRGSPFAFTLGAGQVIRGWDEGVKGMRIGGKRKLTIPPDLGYGSAGAGGVIPPNATLVFEVQLLGVK
ncbi:MAG: FKBP-type peptidyl-prolyl cis-trans isomerase [Candidatus Eisenbacteria bacterium]|uniref:Peptidyl-prolyl cis-trans isomerase n=1 Tax=Eiseniibacteriota bacterium TaxID=2212470 RepID=A0A933W935_UNCEI|nr:FKBP-type peptidyl-prolyl cis-trans isomerase [Candidatus Eisenbacteria bacterium]